MRIIVVWNYTLQRRPWAQLSLSLSLSLCLSLLLEHFLSLCVCVYHGQQRRPWTLPLRLPRSRLRQYWSCWACHPPVWLRFRVTACAMEHMWPTSIGVCKNESPHSSSCQCPPGLSGPSLYLGVRVIHVYVCVCVCVCVCVYLYIYIYIYIYIHTYIHIEIDRQIDG